MKNLTVVALAFLAGACGASKTNRAGGKCRTNSDCSSPLVCTESVCTAASTTGGNNGGATTGTTTAGGSSGASSGSSSGGAPAVTTMRFVNAAPKGSAARDTSAALTLCASVSGGAYAAVASSIAFGAVSDRTTVASASVSLRVVVGTDCTASAFDLATALDASAGGAFTAIAYGDDTTEVTGLTVVKSAAPASGDARLTTVNATPAATVNAALQSPYAQLLGLGAIGASAAVDTAPGNAVISLLSNFTVNATYPLTLAAGDQKTIVLYGDETQVLVIDDTATAAGTMLLTASPLSQLRVANLTNTAIQVCVQPPGHTAFPQNGITVAAQTVTSFASVAAFASGGSHAPIAIVAPSDFCTGTALATGSSYAPVAGSYDTIVLLPAYTSGSSHVPVALTTVRTKAAVPNGIAVTTFNAALYGDGVNGVRTLSDANAVGEPFTLPELFGKNLALDLGELALFFGDTGSLTVPSAFHASLQHRILSIGDVHFDDVSLTSTHAESLWLTGDFGLTPPAAGQPDNGYGRVITCADDGASACTSSSPYLPGGGGFFWRLVNTTSTAQTFCASTTVDTTTTLTTLGTVAPSSATIFSNATALAYDSTVFTITGTDCQHPGTHTDDLALDFPDAFTAIICDGGAKLVSVAAPVPTVVQSLGADVNVTNLLASGTLTNITLGQSAFNDADSGMVSTEDPVTVRTTPDPLVFHSGSTVYTTVLPAAGTPAAFTAEGAFDAFVTAPATGSTSANVLWCNDELLDASGNATCAALSATAP